MNTHTNTNKQTRNKNTIMKNSKTKTTTDDRPQLDLLADPELVAERRSAKWYQHVVRSPKVFIPARIAEADEIYPALSGHPIDDILYNAGPNTPNKWEKMRAEWVRYVVTKSTADAVAWHYRRGHFNPTKDTNFVELAEKVWDKTHEAIANNEGSTVGSLASKSPTSHDFSEEVRHESYTRRILKPGFFISSWLPSLGGDIEHGLINYYYKLLTGGCSGPASDSAITRPQELPRRTPFCLLNDEGVTKCHISGEVMTSSGLKTVKLPNPLVIDIHSTDGRDEKTLRVHQSLAVFDEVSRKSRLCFDPRMAHVKRAWYDWSRTKEEYDSIEPSRCPVNTGPNEGGLYRRLVRGANSKWFPVRMYVGLNISEGYMGVGGYLNDYVCSGVTKYLGSGDNMGTRPKTLHPISANGPQPNTVVVKDNCIERLKYTNAGPKSKVFIKSIPLGSVFHRNFLLSTYQQQFEGTVHKLLASAPLTTNTLASAGAVFVEGVTCRTSQDYTTVNGKDFSATWVALEGRAVRSMTGVDHTKGLSISNYSATGDMKFIPDREEAGANANWIGFEVEKTTFRGKGNQGDYVGPSALFPAIVTDSSCGVEGKTNVYKLERKGATRAEFRRHCRTDKDLLNDPITKKCGGHVNLSGPNISDLSKIRKYSWVIVAMYRHRLKNTYSGRNKKLDHRTNEGKYSVVLVHSNRLEFRLVPAVASERQLMRRYDMFALLAEAVDTDMPLPEYYRKMRSLMKGVYSNEKWGGVMYYASLFQDWADGKEPSDQDQDSADYDALRHFMG